MIKVSWIEPLARCCIAIGGYKRYGGGGVLRRRFASTAVAPQRSLQR